MSYLIQKELTEFWFKVKLTNYFHWTWLPTEPNLLTDSSPVESIQFGSSIWFNCPHFVPTIRCRRLRMGNSQITPKIQPSQLANFNLAQFYGIYSLTNTIHYNTIKLSHRKYKFIPYWRHSDNRSIIRGSCRRAYTAE